MFYNPSVSGTEIRTTRGPFRSNTYQKRTGVVPPARDGSNPRTMRHNNDGTENSIETTCPRCGVPLEGFDTAGPQDHRADPCGCPVSNHYLLARAPVVSGV